MLRQDLAPLSEAAWDAVESEAKDTFTALLCGRRVVDVQGPHGWDHAGYNTGRLDVIDTQSEVTAGLREVQRLVEVRTPFRVTQMTIDTVDRGGIPAFDEVVDAARATALQEDKAIFHGWDAAGIAGITQASAHDPLPMPSDAADMPETVLQATTTLRDAGVRGPYHLVLGDEPFRALSGATRNGVSVRELLEAQLDGGAFLHGTAVEGAVLLSGRGGDFDLDLGHDLALGYASHDRQEVELYITSSFTFRVIDGDAAIAIA